MIRNAHGFETVNFSLLSFLVEQTGALFDSFLWTQNFQRREDLCIVTDSLGFIVYLWISRREIAKWPEIDYTLGSSAKLSLRQIISFI